MLFVIPMVDDPIVMIAVMMLTMMCYMPTIALANTVAYHALKRDGLDVVRDYPPIRASGTIGFLAPRRTIHLHRLETPYGQFFVDSPSALALGLYTFNLPTATPHPGLRTH